MKTKPKTRFMLRIKVNNSTRFFNRTWKGWLPNAKIAPMSRV